MNKLWLCLMLISSSIAIWFGSMAASSLWKYSFLTHKTSAEVQEFKVIQKKSSQFALEASYRFTHEGKVFEAKTEFHKPYYLNQYAAQSACNVCKAKLWQVYFCPSKPEISSLQKIFPFQECIQALITSIICLYFFFMKGFLRKVLPQN